MVDHDNLDEFADPAGYDRKDSSDTGVAFYATLARETGGPVLEIARGQQEHHRGLPHAHL